MSFGLKSGPVTFQRMINTLFSDMLGNGVYAYLDSLLVVPKTKNYLANLEAVFLKLREVGLKAKLNKSEFLKPKICFLGHKVDGDAINTMTDKISAIKNFHRPKTVENVLFVIGLCGYCRSFINGFAKLASPLKQVFKIRFRFTGILFKNAVSAT